MNNQKINRSDAEKVFVACRNISGTTMSAGAAAFWDTTEAIAGTNGVSGAVTGKKHLFAGALKTALNDSSYGLVQTYGMGSIYLVLSDTADSAVPGDQLVAVTSQTYLVDFSGTSLVPAPGENYVTLCDYYSAVAGGNSAPLARTVFIRAM